MVYKMSNSGVKRMRKMKDSGIEWIGQIPEDWGIIRVKQAFIRKNEKAQQENPVVLSLARTGVRMRDVSTNEGQVADSYYNYNPVSVGDLLLNPMDLYSGANCSLSEVEGVISPAYVNLRNKDGYHSKFYDYYFKVQYWMMVLFAHGKGVSFDNRWTLNHETLMNFPIVAPNYETQHRIADFLDDKCGKIDCYIEKQQQIIEKLKEYKQAVITEAVTKGLNHDVPMKDSGIEWIGEIPDHWEIRRLRYLGTCVNGISKGGEFFGSGYPFVSYSDVYKNMVLPTEVSGLVEATESEREWYSVKEGDVFFTRTSETIEEVAFTSTCMKTINNATFAGFLIRFRPTTDLLTKEFSKYYFRSSKHRLFFVKEMNLVTRASLSQELLKRLPVLLPSTEEQKKIAEFLDKKCSELDLAISRKQSIIEKLNEYKKSLIYEAVTGKLEV